MSYEFDLGELDGPYVDHEGSHIVEFVLGTDVDQLVVMSVILFPTEQPGVLELCFGIRTKTETEISDPDYSKYGPTAFIPKDRRSDVLRRIKDAIASLVSNTMPDHIAMESFYPDLPGAALTKYSRVEAEIAGLGYRLQDWFRDKATGIDHWLFTRH